MRLAALLTAGAVGVALAAAPPAATAATASPGKAPWRVGAATVDTTPPGFDPAQDLIDFPEVDPARAVVCPRSSYDGPRRWRFEEPYRDSDGSGDFSYPLSGAGVPAPEPFCDYNGNGRWDGIYVSGQVAQHALQAHDSLDARAIAISDGSRTAVLVSVVAQGLFENYVEEMRARAIALRPGIDQLVVSADHNESSPDTIGIYGAPAAPEDVPGLGGAFGLNSGIDEYYMDYLVERVAEAAAQAYDSRRRASLWEREFRLPAEVCVSLSNNFPTTADDGSPAAIDPKVRVLQARDRRARPVFTLMNLAAHNQEIGHNDALAGDLSSDWPGFFADQLERLTGGGVGLFLVGDNGSEEDPATVPQANGKPECDQDGSYLQAEATGEAFARAVVTRLAGARRVRFGAVSGNRSILYVPVENNLFKAAAAAGLFGERQTYTAVGQPAGRTGPDVRTSVAYLDIGPELQLIANPGEAFPALMLGSPWGIEEVGCPGRPNPTVPTWHSRARYRFQVGLADDMIGYEIPAWAFSGIPGLFADGCTNDADDHDPAGHQHKLESEGLGPTASNAVANQLARLLDRDRSAHPGVRRLAIRAGRYLMRDGSLSRRAAGAVGVWLAPPGSSRLARGEGTVIAICGIRSFGSRRVDGRARFTDYDGDLQRRPGITTRGVRTRRTQYYLDLYPALDAPALGPAQRAPRRAGSCRG